MGCRDEQDRVKGDEERAGGEETRHDEEGVRHTHTHTLCNTGNVSSKIESGNGDGGIL